MKKKQSLAAPLLWTAAACIFTLLVRFVDVKAIGPLDSKVGFAKINKAFAKLIGVHRYFYLLTEILGILAILTAVFFAVTGLVQLIKRKSFQKVDRRLYVLGAFYVILLLIYVFFEKVVINYRPVLENGALAASYPSSHSMIAVFLFGAAIPLWRYYLKNETLLQVAVIMCAVFLVLTVIGRLISGYHWLTDIAGGVLIAAALLFWHEFAQKKWG
ncbi:MAG: phosphatase PAP2 family protein [Lachnospiraceae bacterium]|nr:phosphatase PAP2 family protein [Lachnospiraceae bacterium]